MALFRIDEAEHLDQMNPGRRACRFVPKLVVHGREAKPVQRLGDGAERDVLFAFDGQIGAVAARRLRLDQGADDEGFQALGLEPVAVPGEGQAGDDAGRVFRRRHQMAPPLVGILIITRQGQHAQRVFLALHGFDHPGRGGEPAHGREAAVLIACHVPEPGLIFRNHDGHGKGAFEAQGRDDQFTPDARQFAAREGALVALHQAIDDFRLARRADLDAFALFDLAHVFHHLGPLHDQIMELLIDFIDLLAQVGKRGFAGLCHGVAGRWWWRGVA